METRSSQYLLVLKWLLVLVLLVSGTALAEINQNHADFITVEPPIDIAIEPNEIFEPRFNTETAELTLPAGDTLATERQVAYTTLSIQAGFSVTPLHDVQIRSYQILGAPLQPGTTATIEIEVVNFASQPTGIMAVDFLFQKNQASPTRLITLPAGGSSTLDFDWDIPFYTPGPNDLVPLYFLSFVLSEEESEQNIENDRLDLRFGFDKNDGTFAPLDRAIGPLHKIEEGKEVHQWIAKEAYDYFASQIEGADIGDYLGTIGGSHGDNRNTLLEGTAAEDKSCRPPLYQCWPDMPYFRHFCAGADGGEIRDGYLAFGSALTQAENIWTHATSAYSTNRALSFYYLGHIAHLVADMTVPAHTHNDPHVQILGDGDAYEETMAYSDNYKLWRYDSGRSYNWWDHKLTLFSSPYSLFYRTANYTEDYDSDDYDGDGPPYYNPDDYPDTWHHPENVSRSGGVDIGEITVIGDDLMPYAMRRVADLYRLFYKEVDTSDPTVTMTYPTSEDVSNPNYRTSTSAFNLTTLASDPQSGIVKEGYRFRWSYWMGSSWSDWADVDPSPTDSSVSFSPQYNNTKYAFHVWAKNGGGEFGDSSIKYLYVDATNPSSPTITGYSDSSHSTTLVSGNEYPYPNPHFHFSASDSGSGIKGYYYYWGTNPNADPSTWNTSGHYTASGLTSGNDYYFRVKAKDKAGNIGSISTFTYKYRVCTPPSITSHPSPPSLTICSGQSHQYCVSASGTPPLSYQWQKNGTDIPGATSSCYTATQSGSYRCRVSNSCGSVYSNSATLTVNTPPSLPSNFSDSSVTTDSITWTWQDNSNNEDGFRGHDPSHNVKWTAPANTTSKTESGLSVNTQYTRHVHAYNTCGESSPSNGHSMYTLANAPGAAPFSNITRMSIQANWTANGNPPGTQYLCENVTRGTDSGWITEVYWNETGLDCGTQYCYQVKAKNGDGVETTPVSLGCQTTLTCPVPDIRVSESSYDYDSVVVGSYEDWILTIYNDGDANLSITDLNGLEATDFSLIDAPSLPFTIEPNESNDLTVRFTPSSGGIKTATLSIENNDYPTDVNLMGTGIYPPVIYVDVDANGADSGTSWADAFVYLQDALNYAENTGGDVNEIRVAQGIYTPDSNSADPNGSGDRAATFHLINGVALRGGYAGFGEPDPNARDIELYDTILSGDLDGNDVDVNDPCDLLTEPTRGENSYHVVTGSGTDQTTLLDGFTITAGNANGSAPHNNGGGMFNNTSSPTVSNCTFSGNSADWGGGMHNNVSSPTVSNCTFSGNSADYRGGGMRNSNTSSPTVSNCTFSGNSADREGGGMLNFSSSPTVTDCIFTNNSADYGGGMYNAWDSSPTVTGCTFSGNLADYEGGGGMFNNASSPTVTGCTFSGNSAEWGGGMVNYDNSSPTVSNCTFSGNSAELGGGMVNYISSPTVSNCILWGNTASSGGNEIALTYSSTIDVDYSDVQGGLPGIYDDGSGNTINWGIGNIEDDPCFVDPNNDDYHLLPQSLCIDSGDPNYVAEANEVDIDGDARVIAGRIDMGADEYAYGELSDFNGDGIVNFKDFSILAYYWMDYLCSEPDWCEGSDFDESETVDPNDLRRFTENWLWQAIWYSQ